MCLSKRDHMLRNACTNTPTVLTVTGVTLIFIVILFDQTIPFHFLLPTLTAPFRLSVLLVSSSSPETTTDMAHSSRSHHHTGAKPPSKKEIGNAGWTLIHSIAANFPEEPTENDQRYAKLFLKSIAKLYPCKRCQHHFDKYLAASPPDVSSRNAFVVWACDAHNDVNRRNGKREFPCQMPALEQRWGDCGCRRKKK